jgi:hypothetical protein
MTDSASASPSLEVFIQAANADHSVYLDLTGATPRLAPAPPAGTRPSIPADLDTTTLFIDALARRYGSGVGRTVSRELALCASPGEPLAARKIARAVAMAETARQALDGVDFATRLACMASAQGAVFRRVCAQLGVDMRALDTVRRARIDCAMRKRFDEAAVTDSSPVSIQTAETWLCALVAIA